MTWINPADAREAERHAAARRGRSAGFAVGRVRFGWYVTGEELWRCPEGREEGENAVYWRGGYRDAYRAAAISLVIAS